MKKSILFLASLLFFTTISLNTQAQILKRLDKKVTRKVNNRIDRKVDKKIDEGLDEAEGIGKKSGDTNSKDSDGQAVNTNKNTNSNSSSNGDSESAGFSYTSKFDFVPGDKIILYEDFSGDAIGDLPAAWNTNGTAEVVRMNNHDGKWMMMNTGSIYIPDLDKDLPDDYTLEFDLYASGLDRQTSSGAKMSVFLSETKSLTQHDKNYANFTIPFCQYSAVGMVVRNNVSDDKEAIMHSTVKTDLRKDVLNKIHVAIGANKKRLRVWINEDKEIDVPRLMPNYKKINYIKFLPHGFKDGKEQIFISNIRLAEGGQDLRSQLETKGKYSTTGILFNTNSATILPESAGVVKEIAAVLKDNSGMKIKITGHTDSDGDNNSNLKLSQQRAMAVKEALVRDFNIDASRIVTEGKGESAPVADNGSALGKAQNRRVDFEKM